MAKRMLGKSVLDAARERVSRVFDDFPRVLVSFSGGKDSSVMTHLVAEEAIRRGRKFGLLFIDWEAQYQLTIDHVAEVFEQYKDHCDPFWICGELKTVNACSMHEPEWVAWDSDKQDIWVRDLPQQRRDLSEVACYKPRMTFEDFVPAFGHWYADGQLCAAFVGIRTQESLNRWRSIARAKKATFEGLPWTTWHNKTLYNAYPIYDWQTEDIWTANARFGWSYNRIYDRMHQAGLTLHQMRICEPYGDEQRKGLWLYHLLEPQTWAKVVNRVAGASSASLYATESGNILGNRKIYLPDGHTWQSYAMLILRTMPPATAEHYRDKIAVYIKYCMDHYGMVKGLPDCVDGDTSSKDVPSWRRICRCLLRNDYWCKSLSFSVTKSEAYEKYRKMMKQRRDKWQII